MSEMNLTSPSSPSDSYLVIPCPPDQFGEFISNLLGKPQIISKVIPGNFSVSHEEICNFFHIIQHRVHEQQQASLVQFAVKTFYNDGSAFEVNSIEEFVSYAEIKPLIPVSISIIWVYLVKFSNRNAPERQQIDVSIRINNKKYDGNHLNVDDTDDFAVGAIQARRFGPFSPNTGFITFRISHTARSWGMDIEGLLTTHTNNIVRDKENRFREWIRRRAGTLGFLIFFLNLVFFLSVGYRILVSQWQNRMNEYRRLLIGSSETMVSLQTKIDFVAERLTGRDTLFWVVMGITYILISIILCSFIGLFSCDKAESNMPSFIVLSKKSSDYRDNVMRSYHKNFMTFSITFVYSLASGVLGNILFVILWGP